MFTPRYVARRHGNDFVLVRVDTPEVATRLGVAAAGLSLLAWGARRSGFCGVLSSAIGAGLIYRGWTGRNPMDLLRDLRGRWNPPQEDDLDEALKESFPASDPISSMHAEKKPENEPSDAQKTSLSSDA